MAYRMKKRKKGNDEEERKVGQISTQQHTQEAQNRYQSYYKYCEKTPFGVEATSALFPHNPDMSSRIHAPIGFSISPMLMEDNDKFEVLETTADKVLKCQTCGAYMNCFNELKKKNYVCFYCGRQNYLQRFSPSKEPNNEMNSVIYQTLGASGFYNTIIPQETFIIVMDISPQAAKCRMIQFAVAAMKEVLNRQELNKTFIHFYTYDTMIHEYQFDNEETKCTIYDQSIEDPIMTMGNVLNRLGNIRNTLFQFLDQLESISKTNPRHSSNFITSFKKIYHSLKKTGGKFFIFQAHDSLSAEEWVCEESLKIKKTDPITPNSILESKNKIFFNQFIADMLNHVVSVSMFFFAGYYKNLRAFADLCKISSSTMHYYRKEENADLDRFYYDLSYFLGCTYFHDVHTQFIPCFGWRFTAIYSNSYKVKDKILFRTSYIEPSRKFMCLLEPIKVKKPTPYCAIQVAINYRYRLHHYFKIISIVHPVTGYIDRMYQNIDVNGTINALAKPYLSSLRMDSLKIAKKKMSENASFFYISALDHFKKKQYIPDSVISILNSILAMLKCTHSQLDMINNTPMLDQVLAERNFLQFTGSLQTATFFSPYLFDLSNLQPHMCQEEQFVYPPTLQLKFNNIKQGVYLLDNGLCMYLFIAKKCRSGLLEQIFGKSKFQRNQQILEYMLVENQTMMSYQIQNLIRILREQKSYGWSTLYIVRCGENSVNERNFFLNFFTEKYQQFRSYNFSPQEFLALASKPGSF